MYTDEHKHYRHPNPVNPVNPVKIPARHLLRIGPVVLLLLLTLLLAILPAAAQEGGAVQEIFGRAETDAGDVYRLDGLSQGQIVYLYADAISGNLDPFLLIADGDQDLDALGEAYDSQLSAALATGRDPILALPEILGDITLAWDDDGGQGYDAALTFEVPADGDYWLLLLAAPTSKSFGRYRLLIGLDAPQVLEGDAQPTGDVIAMPALSRSMSSSAVQQITGTLSTDRSSTFFELNELEPGDSFYAYAEATSGNLAPVLILEDFGGKPVRTGNFTGQETSATLEFTALDTIENYVLNVEACCRGESTTVGDFHLLVGRNAPEVLDGAAESTGSPILGPRRRYRLASNCSKLPASIKRQRTLAPWPRCRCAGMIRGWPSTRMNASVTCALSTRPISPNT
jgi:hypothetical protein